MEHKGENKVTNDIKYISREEAFNLIKRANDNYKSALLHLTATQDLVNELLKKVNTLEKNLIEQGKQISDNDNQIRHIQEFHGIPKEEETE